MPEDQLLFVYSQVFDGLRYLKFSGVAHKDIKPENILINLSTGVVKIIDFGISVEGKPTETKPWDKSGTPKYYPWECLYKGDIKYNPFQGDVLSAGISLLETACGAYPLIQKKGVKLWSADNKIFHAAKEQKWNDVFNVLETMVIKKQLSDDLKALIAHMCGHESHRATIEQVMMSPFVTKQAIQRESVLQQIRERADTIRAQKEDSLVPAGGAYYRGDGDDEDFSDEEGELAKLPMAQTEDFERLENSILLKKHPLAVKQFLEEKADEASDDLQIESAEVNSILVKVNGESHQDEEQAWDFDAFDFEESKTEPIDLSDNEGEEEEAVKVGLRLDVMKTEMDKKALLLVYPEGKASQEEFENALFRLEQILAEAREKL